LSELPPDAPVGHLPADYYSRPRTEAERIAPRWLTMGCGALALVILIALFAGGALVSSGHAGQLVDLWFQTLQDELISQTDADVPSADKTTFVAEFTTLRQNVKAQKVKADDLLPLIRGIVDATKDHHVTRAELTALTQRVHAANTHP